MNTEKKLADALRACVADTTAAEYAATVEGAANMTARDWLMRAIETAREEDKAGNNDAFGDIVDDLKRALARMDSPREALAEYDAKPRASFPATGCEFLVTWRIDSSAATPEAAAREAWDAMRRPDSIANVFDVSDEAGNVIRVDLGEHGASPAPGLAAQCHALADALQVREAGGAFRAVEWGELASLSMLQRTLRGFGDAVEADPEHYGEAPHA